jgi:hypothetical protein
MLMEGKANLAGVVRNHEGTGLLAWLNRIGACTSELAEALAMSRGSAKGGQLRKGASRN